MMYRKMLRDLRSHLGQFITILIMAFLAVFLYAGLIGEVAGVEAARQTYHTQTNLADGWVYGSGYDAEAEVSLLSLDGISEAQMRLELLSSGEGETNLFLYFQDSSRISMPYLFDGVAFDPSDASGIWLNKRFADENGIGVGDSYTVTVDGTAIPLTVAGLVWSPEYEHYKWETDVEADYKHVGYGFCSVKALPEDAAYSYNQIVLKTTVPDVLSLEGSISTALGGEYHVFTDRSGVKNITALDDEINQHRVMGGFFSLLFLLIALLTIVTTMRRMVNNQRTQIGTMKALGVNNKKIYWHYLSYGFFLSLIGAAAGILLGPITLAPMLFDMKYFIDTSAEYMLPPISVVYPPSFFVMGAVVVIFCTLASWLSCRRLLQIIPAETLRPAPPKTAKPSIWEKLPFWNRLGFSSRYNLRDMGRNRLRTFMGFTGTLCCMALLVCGFATKENFESAIYDWYLRDILGDGTFITFEASVPLEEAERIRTDVDGELVMSDTIEIRVPGGEKYSSHINVFEGLGLCNTTNVDLQVFTLTGTDFAVTAKMAKTLGVEAGDPIEWHQYSSGEWVTSTVTVINRMPFEQGITTTRQAVEEAGLTFSPTRIYTREAVDDYESEFVTSVRPMESFEDTFQDMMGLLNLVLGFLLVLALLLSVVVLYSLGLLTFAEWRKEMSTLKVLGFKTRQLRGLLLRQNLWLSLAGAVCGTPLGLKLLQVICDSQGDAYDVPATCSLFNFFLSFAITIGVSVVVNYFFSNRIRDLDMVSELKGLE